MCISAIIERSAFPADNIPVKPKHTFCGAFVLPFIAFVIFLWIQILKQSIVWETHFPGGHRDNKYISAHRILRRSNARYFHVGRVAAIYNRISRAIQYFNGAGAEPDKHRSGWTIIQFPQINQFHRYIPFCPGRTARTR